MRKRFLVHVATSISGIAFTGNGNLKMLSEVPAIATVVIQGFGREWGSLQYAVFTFLWTPPSASTQQPVGRHHLGKKSEGKWKKTQNQQRKGVSSLLNSCRRDRRGRPHAEKKSSNLFGSVKVTVCDLKDFASDERKLGLASLTKSSPTLFIHRRSFCH